MIAHELKMLLGIALLLVCVLIRASSDSSPARTFPLLTGMIYAVVLHLVWKYILITSTFQPGDQFFEFGFSHPIASAAVILAGAIGVMVALAGYRSLRKRSGLPPARRFALACATLISIITLIFSATTGWRAQRLLDQHTENVEGR